MTHLRPQGPIPPHLCARASWGRKCVTLSVIMWLWPKLAGRWGGEWARWFGVWTLPQINMRPNDMSRDETLPIFQFQDALLIIMDDLSNCTPLPNNADVQGFIIRLSLFISHLCFVTLLFFSRESLRMVVGSLLLQNYGLLIASFVFIRLEKVSPNDIHFVLNAVYSPAFQLLIWPTLFHFICLILRKRVEHQSSPLRLLHLPSQLLILGIVPVWVTLNAVTWLDASLWGMGHHASNICAHRDSFGMWTAMLEYRVLLLHLHIIPFCLDRLTRKWPDHCISILFLGLSVGFLLPLAFILVVIELAFLRPRVAAYSIFILWTVIWGFNLGVYH
ncbi:hypothetical protein FRC19_010300 [Serendipita sp. 401]|nr:hypothetical protein FRC19_010300 [Serendipita sp. 401]